MTREKLYYYAGYDMVHQMSSTRNFYYDTKENIMEYLKSTIEFKSGTSQEEIDESLERWFITYTTEATEKTKKDKHDI